MDVVPARELNYLYIYLDIVWLIVFAIVGLYVASAEIVKRVFYQWDERHGS